MRRAVLVGAAVACLAAHAAAAELVIGPYLTESSPTSATLRWEVDAPLAADVLVTASDEPARTFHAEPAARGRLVLGDLRPSHRYQYTLTVGSVQASGEFATAPAGDEPFAFVVFGDNRTNIDVHRVVVQRMRREVPDFVISTGDSVDEGARESDWRLFFAVERDLLADNVLHAAAGNHDLARAGEDPFVRFFAPASEEQTGRNYAFRYGAALFLVTDTNVESHALTDQTAWLEGELSRAAADPAVRHVFVVTHHPLYSVSLHGGAASLRQAWAPLFARFGVDAVFSGHDHCFARAEADGVRYFVSGGAGAPLYPRDPSPDVEDMVAGVVYERAFHYLRVHVAGSSVEVDAIRDDGTLIESMGWDRSPDVGARAGRPVRAAVFPAAPRRRSVRGGCAVGRGGGFAESAAYLVGLTLAAWLRARSSPLVRSRRCRTTFPAHRGARTACHRRSGQ